MAQTERELLVQRDRLDRNDVMAEDRLQLGCKSDWETSKLTRMQITKNGMKKESIRTRPYAPTIMAMNRQRFACPISYQNDISRTLQRFRPS